jgi:hypothetical protein
MPCLYYNKTRFSATKVIKNDQMKYKFEPIIRISRIRCSIVAYFCLDTLATHYNITALLLTALFLIFNS